MSIEHHLHAPASNKNTKAGFEAPDSLMTGRKQTVSPPLENISPEIIYSVPNPFAVTETMPNTVSAGSMSSAGFGPPSPRGAAPHAAQPVAPFFPSDKSPTENSVMIAASGIRVPGTSGVAHEQPRAPAQAAVAAAKAKKPSSLKNKESPQSNNPKQKRLERNRESARLSRRRRKQYLEVLEERVNQLSFEMDKGRREHVAMALPVVQEQRLLALQNQDLAALETSLSRASREMRLAATFQSQQLQSLVFPPPVKFLLWMSLQTDAYFRGGRAASERLSAARIGERVSHLFLFRMSMVAKRSSLMQVFPSPNPDAYQWQRPSRSSKWNVASLVSRSGFVVRSRRAYTLYTARARSDARDLARSPHRYSFGNGDAVCS